MKGDILLLNLERTVIRKSEKICNWSEGQDGMMNLVFGDIGSRTLGILDLRWARALRLNWLLRQSM